MSVCLSHGNNASKLINLRYCRFHRWVAQGLFFDTNCHTCYRKAHTTGTATYLSQHLHQHTATYSTRSSSLPLLTVPNPSTVFARRAFNYTAPTAWNSLPADILTCDSESGFKRLLKTHLLTTVLTSFTYAYGALQICLWYDMIPFVAGTPNHNHGNSCLENPT